LYLSEDKCITNVRFAEYVILFGKGMNYYEELRLSPSATVQEIRHAYKLLAQLVHPDRQGHEPVRHMAERQMLRLNEMLATLTNEQTRREYDASLAAAASLTLAGSDGTTPASFRMSRPTRGPVPWWRDPLRPRPQADSSLDRLPGWVQPIVERWFWISLTLAMVCVGAWYAAQMRSESAGSRPLSLVQDAKRPLPDEPQLQRQNSRTGGGATVRKPPQSTSRRAGRSNAVESPAKVTAGQALAQRPAQTPSFQSPPPETGPQEALRGPPSASSTETVQPPPSYVAAGSFSTVSTVSIAPTQSSSLAGNWLYVPDPTEKLPPGAYPATYVELMLAEERGRLRGTYRAQYQVLDRAVSQEVSFQVQGDTPAGTSANFQWTSADGARGDFEIAMTGPNAIKVTWWATRLGRNAALASGMAKLIRQQVR
jgi:hypothetical protein